MTTEPTNSRRAARIDRILDRYGTDDTPQGSLIDLLADVRHWCDRSDEAFGELDRIAYQNYLAEIHEERTMK